MAGDFFDQQEKETVGVEEKKKEKKDVEDYNELKGYVQELKGKYKLENDNKAQLIGEEVIYLEGIPGKEDGEIKMVRDTINDSLTLKTMNVGRNMLNLLKTFERYIKHNKDFLYNIKEYYIPDFLWLIRSYDSMVRRLEEDKVILRSKIKKLEEKKEEENREEMKEKILEDEDRWSEYEHSERGKWIMENIVPKINSHMLYVRSQSPMQYKELNNKDRMFIKSLQRRKKLPYLIEEESKKESKDNGTIPS